MTGEAPGHHRFERAGYVSSKDRRRMLEVSIVDAKVSKSSRINKINCYHGRGRRGHGGDGPIACGSAAEVTNDKSERADCIKC